MRDTSHASIEILTDEIPSHIAAHGFGRAQPIQFIKRRKSLLCFLCVVVLLLVLLLFCFWLANTHARTSFFTNGKSFKKDFNTSRDWGWLQNTCTRDENDRDFDPQRKKGRKERNGSIQNLISNGFVSKLVFEIKLRVNATFYYTTHRVSERERARLIHFLCTILEIEFVAWRWWKYSKQHRDTIRIRY